MPTLKPGELATLGDHFLALAQSVGNYRMDNRSLLSRVENQQIKDLHWTLLNYADDFYTTSAKLVMDDIQPSLERIGQITARINRSYRRLQHFQKAIDIATAAVTLAASIFSKNPVRITEAIYEFIDVWNEGAS